MDATCSITTKNLRRLAFVAGFDGVAGLARSISRSRVTVWRAVRHPNRYGPTYRAVERALQRRTR